MHVITWGALILEGAEALLGACIAAGILGWIMRRPDRTRAPERERRERDLDLAAILPRLDL